MGRPYTAFNDYPKRIVEWLKRSDAKLEYDIVNDTLYITSENKEQPLNNSEKIHICQYLVMRHHAFKRVKFT